MSTIHKLWTCGRVATNTASLNLKNSPAIKYPTYSSYRGIWSSLLKRKEASDPAQNVEKMSAEGADPQVEELLKALEEMKENRDELNDKYKRALAENENIRNRLNKQIQDTKIFAIQGFCKDLLEVADVLNKATECVPKTEVTDKNPHLKNLYEGLTMTESILKSVFQKYGLEQMNPVDEKFNPNLHEALFEQAVEGKPAGVVVVVSKTGYKLHDRVIRPALVGVSK